MTGLNMRRRVCRELISDEGSCPSSITIALSKALPIKQQIAEANRLITTWLARLEEPFDHRLDGLYLTECRSNGTERICSYEIFERYPN
ncbi:MAG: hypothetical protein JXL84_17405 [Deltaproteobacteria bacterium]|nr:hypothetical protein [Deltaproteobacteria bacterium]